MKKDSTSYVMYHSGQNANSIQQQDFLLPPKVANCIIRLYILLLTTHNKSKTGWERISRGVYWMI